VTGRGGAARRCGPHGGADGEWIAVGPWVKEEMASDGWPIRAVA
jgi:hypothetical protein